jgi:RNA polymerase sigma-70 factor (ECF subfamily)
MTAPDLLLSRLERAMATMPSLSREIFLAHRLDGLSFEEIGRRTGLSVRQVERHIAHAIAHIDRMLTAMEKRDHP